MGVPHIYLDAKHPDATICETISIITEDWIEGDNYSQQTVIDIVNALQWQADKIIRLIDDLQLTKQKWDSSIHGANGWQDMLKHAEKKAVDNKARLRDANAEIARLTKLLAAECRHDECRKEIERLNAIINDTDEQNSHYGEYRSQRIADLEREVERLRNERELYRELLCDVAVSGVEYAGEKYVTVQIDPDIWTDITAIRERSKGNEQTSE